MSIRNISYVSSAAIPCTLASLASSTTLTAGQESNLVDNSVALSLDYLVSGKVTTGTSPAIGTIEVWCIAELDDTTWPDVFDGTDSNETVTTRDILIGAALPVWSIIADATSNRTYYMPKTSIAGLFGGVCPRKFVLFLTQNTTVNLNATGGNHAFYQEAIVETLV